MGKLLAWAVHIFTASGVIFCFISLVAMTQADFRSAFLWLYLALIVDGFDGMMARAAKVEEHLPRIQGKIMDHLIDFIGYAFLPAYFFYVSDLMPEDWRWLGTGVVLLTSIIYYAKEGMVSSDYYFVGFPVLWNIVGFYLFFVFHLQPMTNLIVLIILGILHFIPLKYAYPSRMIGFRKVVWTLTLLGLTSAAIVIWQYPTTNDWLRWLLMLVLLGFTILVGLASNHTSQKAQTELP
jgi:phosphatidylcholine synthase